MKESETKLEHLRFGDWYSVRDTSMDLINRHSNQDPSVLWKCKILMAERAPLRKMYINFKFKGMPYATAEYFVRNFPQIQWFISETNRESVKEPYVAHAPDEIVSVEGFCDALSLIEVSRKALCYIAPDEVRKYWDALKKEIKTYQPELSAVMVNECVYRGFCPEFQCCGYVRGSAFYTHRKEYMKGFKDRTDGQTVDAVTGTVYNDYVVEGMNANKKRLFRKHQSQVSQSDSAED